MMKNSKNIINITKKITGIYNYILKLELRNKLDDEYYSFLAILKDLLNKENDLFDERQYVKKKV